MFRTLKIKFTIAFSATLTVAILILANLLYIFGVVQPAPELTLDELQDITTHRPQIHKYLEDNPEIENLVEIGSIVREKQRQRYTVTLIVITVPAIVLSTVAAYALASYLVKPIEDLASILSSLNTWDVSKRVPEQKSSEEIEALITSFNNLLEELEKSFRTQENFIQDAAHELRTPIAATKATLQVFKNKKDPTKDEYKQLVETVESLNSQLVRLNEALLFLNRKGPDRGKFIKININELLEEVLESLSSISKTENVSIQFNPKGKKKVNANPEKLARALQNIVENAIKYSKKDKGKVTITTADKDKSIEITIKDNGIGIPKKDLPNIFDRFYRGANVHDRSADGSGLGLSIVKKIVEDHSGEISVSSRKNRGTTFKISLPKV
ncbi:HAMP domain-containing histidine kinase [Candidatus Dojkabacteria bacterium]|nr:HAMP domain-containing histidine kinase [Candidatus Dojkabacteria bacterium]